MKQTALLSALVLGLGACPLPQPLPDYSVGQTVTPPRIVVDDTVHKVSRPETIIEVPAGCTGAKPTYDLQVYLRDANTTESIVGRWFVNYTGVALSPSVVIQQTDEIQAPPTNATEPDLRQSNVFVFSPYDRSPYGSTGGGDSRSVGALHVVEYVVSNGFDTNNGNTDSDRPNRRPAEATKSTPAFEVQVYRWVFLTVPSTATPCP